MRNHMMFTLALAAAATTACDDTATAPLPLPPQITVETGTVIAYIVQEAGGTPDRVTLTLHVQGKDVPVAAYQGALEFDPAAMEVIEATAPGDGSRLVNAQAGPGLLKFAGFSAEPFTGTTAVRLVVRPITSIAAANLRPTLAVVGEATGTAVAKDRMLATPGVLVTAPPR